MSSSTSLNTGVTFERCKGLEKVPCSLFLQLLAFPCHLVLVFPYHFLINFKRDCFYVAIDVQGFVNPLTTNALHHIEEISQLFYSANQLTGFYMTSNIGRYTGLKDVKTL